VTIPDSEQYALLDAAAEDGFAYPAVNVTFIQVRPG
jgi:hypothetical protein